MSLISLLIALAAERYLSSSAWQFNVYFSRYLSYIKVLGDLATPNKSLVANGIFILLPVVGCYLLLSLVENSLLHFLLSTIILIVCFGCVKTRDCYKQYLMAAFRGENTTCDLHYQTLLNDKNTPDIGFGQLLIWLNYRYFIAIMIFFVAFGAPGVLLYRMVCKLNESNVFNEKLQKNESDELATSEATEDNFSNENIEEITSFNEKVLFWLDWLPVRIVAFGYMLVGHFSRALPVWLENLFDVGKLPHQILITVAQKSEDFMVDKDDCTAEPCLLVRLAKRTLLLCLAVIAILILTGVIN